jgi:hydrogenase maturation protein HypF
MLPYSPLHHLILQQFNRPIVLTSGNLSNEPQCIDNEVARSQLGAIADYFVFHNREIINRVDDSVVRVVNDRPQLLRRARGYAPAPIALPPDFAAAPPILAMGSELKNTFCLLRQGQAILSQHLGDLENPAADQAYQESLNLYLNLFEHQPQLIAVDHHPDYRSTQLGKELAIANHLPYETIQHHHAHIAACMAEHQLPLDAAPVLGIALDGLGYGLDQTLWGGEFLLADYRDFQRLAHFKPVAMLGGVQAIYQPWRNTYAQLLTALSWDDLQQQYGDLELIQFLAKQPRLLLDAMLKQNINSPLTSSCGRLFDAVAAALGLCRVRCTYEGQGAIQLEAIATPHLTTPRIASQLTGYPFAIDETHELQPAPMWQQLLTDLKHGIEPAVIAARFHLGLTEAIEHLTQRLRHTHAVTKVVLTGGVFQNRLLQQRVHQKLTQLGLTVLTHQQVPPNDGGLSLGQAAIAAARLLARSNSS